MKNKSTHACWFLLLVGYILSSTFALAEDWSYTVRPGDNLWNLTEKHLTSLKYAPRLQKHNNIQNPYEIKPGTKIRIPLAWTKQRNGNARIVMVHGVATIHRSGSQESIKAEPGVQLVIGDEIQSLEDAFVTIEFLDQSRLRIQKKSRIRLSDMKVYGDLGLAETMVDLLYGRTENIVPTEAEVDSRFSIKTPSATSSVRGTDFRIGVMAEGESSSSEVLAGLVQVLGEKKKIKVPAGFGSVTTLGAPPSPPLKLLPPPDLSDTPVLFERIPLVISLNALDNASAYRAQIAIDEKFEKLWTDFTTETLPFRDGDIPDGDYWLRVRGIDSSGIEGYDAVIAFVVNARPISPFVMAPLPDAVVEGENPSFRWTAQPGVARYIVEISQSADFSTPAVFKSEVTGEYLQLTDSLMPGHYFWRISSVSTSEGIGPFSDTMAFRVPVPGPPLEDLAIDESEITFAWPAAAEGQHFYFQLSRDEEFSDILYEEQTTESFVTLPRPESGNYSLRIKTIEADGFEGPYGSPQRVEIPSESKPYWLLFLLFPLFILL